jgi:hypothetical protein
MALGLAWWLSATAVVAQPEDMDRAKQLFKTGLEDMLGGRYERGCPALAESYELSKLPGALFTLAECEAKWGKLASALSNYQQYLALFVKLTPEQREKQAERKRVATEQVSALNTAVPKLTILLPELAPAGTVVSLDGTELPPAALGVPRPVDPGEHTVEVTWPDGATKEYPTSLEAGGKRQVVIQLPKSGDGPGPRPDGGDDGSTMRISAYVVGAVGIALVATGAITGGAAIGTKSGIDDNCDGTVCTQEGKDAADTTQMLGNVSTATFIIGGAALAAATVVFLLAPDGDGQAGAESASRGHGLRLRPWVSALPGDDPAAHMGVVGSW